MPREMLINAEEEECRIAVLDDGHLEELYLERASLASQVGNIYKGRVTNVEKSIQAAFVDFGLPKHGFLHVSDLHSQYFPSKKASSSEPIEPVGRKKSRRERPPIQHCLKRGQDIIVVENQFERAHGIESDRLGAFDESCSVASRAFLINTAGEAGA